MSSPTLKKMYYNQESWFNCKSSGNLGWSYQFLRPIAAILDFRTFMGQILVDFFFGHLLYPFVIFFGGQVVCRPV